MIKLCYFKFLVLVCLIFVGLAGFAFSQTENSCTTCVAAAKKWCAGVGCIAATSNCPPNVVAVISTDTNGCANVDTCDGCTSATKGNKSWCTVNDHKGKPAQIYCTPKVANGQPNPACSGTTHNVCPTDAKLLNALPVYKDCAACKAGAPNVSALKKWCVSKYFQGCIDAGDDCSDGTKHDDCTDTTIAGKLDYLITSTCGTCVHIATKSWCKLNARGLEVAGCIDTADAATKCSGTSTASRTCTSKDESFVMPNPLSYNCEVCTAAGHKWCIKADSTLMATARVCGLEGICPAGSVEKTENCSDVADDNHKFSFIPPVHKMILESDCKTCKPAGVATNSWCEAGGAKVCLPSSLFGFYCPKADAACTADNDSHVLPLPPLYLPSTCQECTPKDVWCTATIENQVYAVCLAKQHESLCSKVKGTSVTDCSAPSSHPAGALPKLAHNCNDCIAKKHKWFVSSVFGLKSNLCLPALVADLISGPGVGVAYSHCNIAKEDQDAMLGLYTYKVGSSFVSSFSVVAIAVSFCLYMF